MVNGIINVYKEKGYTSFDVVAKLRGIFKQKKSDTQGHSIRMRKGCCLCVLVKPQKSVTCSPIKAKNMRQCSYWER